MKTKLPEPAIWQERWRRNESGEIIAHEAPFTAFTESQLRAAMVDAYNEGIEDAAKVCKGMTCYTYEQGTAERRAWNEATIEAGHYLTEILRKHHE